MPTCFVAEDDDDLLAGITEELTAAGWEVVTARSPFDAVQVTSSVDVLLVDEHWPTPEGLATEEWFRREDRLARIPLVLMTASVPRASISHAGITIEKPFNGPQLVRALDRVVGGAGQAEHRLGRR